MRSLKRFAPVLAILALASAVAVPLVADADPPGNLDRTVRRMWGGAQIGQSGTAIADSYAATATLDIASITSVTCLDTALGSNVTGAAVGDVCVLGLPAAPTANVAFSCFVSAADTVKIRACNPTGSAVDPASASYSVRVFDP